MDERVAIHPVSCSTRATPQISIGKNPAECGLAASRRSAWESPSVNETMIVLIPHADEVNVRNQSDLLR
jgi:hypothetical protein